RRDGERERQKTEERTNFCLLSDYSNRMAIYKLWIGSTTKDLKLKYGIGPYCVLMASLYEYYVYVFRLMPSMSDEEWWRNFIIGHCLIAMAIWSYIRLLLAKPPAVPAAYYLPTEFHNEISACNDDESIQRILWTFALSRSLRINREYIRYCNTCKCIRPEFAHHCTACEMCLLRNDHHCGGLTDRCVHRDSTKMFIQFQFYILALCIFAFITDFHYTYHTERKNYWFFWYQPSFSYIGLILVLTFTCSLFLLAIATNRTTRDINRTGKIFAINRNGHQGVIKNLLNIFGYNPLMWFLPVPTDYHMFE
uniref:Palmitoyltransferase n=1 Tax=Parascaris univalens TaxID=6257 RepID=A0A915BUW5_PARUN